MRCDLLSCAQWQITLEDNGFEVFRLSITLSIFFTVLAIFSAPTLGVLKVLHTSRTGSRSKVCASLPPELCPSWVSTYEILAKGRRAGVSQGLSLHQLTFHGGCCRFSSTCIDGHAGVLFGYGGDVPRSPMPCQAL